MVKFVYTMFLLILINTQYLSQSIKKFGVDSYFLDHNFIQIIKEKNDYKNFFQEYSIKFLRFPGGSSSRYFIWNNTELTRAAYKHYIQYKNRRKNINSNIGDIQTSLNMKNYDSYELYSDFLKFCSSNSITPIIQLNTVFYTDNNKLYQIDKFKEFQTDFSIEANRWEVITGKIVEQINFTHKYVDEVIWEFGNEDYYMYNPEEYARIVDHYLEIIDEEYSDDEVIVELANSYYGGRNKKKWNKEFIRILENKLLCDKIDYFAPHFYFDREEVLKGNSDIDKKIIEIDPLAFERELIDYFDNYSNPKFFYTEFGIFKKAYNHPNYNTRLNALLMLYNIMKFQVSKNLYGVIHHGFTQDASGLFFQNSFLKKVDYSVEEFESEGPSLFKYIPPQAEAIKIFYSTIGDNIVEHIERENCLILVSTRGNNTIIHALNYGNTGMPLGDINFKQQFHDQQVLRRRYYFNELYKRSFNIENNSVHDKSVINRFMAFPPYSLTVINISN